MPLTGKRDIGEILLDKDGHIRVEASAVRHRQIGMRAPLHFVAILLLHCVG